MDMEFVHIDETCAKMVPTAEWIAHLRRLSH